LFIYGDDTKITIADKELGKHYILPYTDLEMGSIVLVSNGGNGSNGSNGTKGKDGNDGVNGVNASKTNQAGNGFDGFPGMNGGDGGDGGNGGNGGDILIEVSESDTDLLMLIM